MGNERKYKIIVYGATGFTGSRICKYLKSQLQDDEWAAAGRTEAKLKRIHKHVVVADAGSSMQLTEMAGQAELIINAVGPYRFSGLQVVGACVAKSTLYVDVSGEPEFFVKSQLNFNELAQLTGTYVVHACGFDSVPNDCGVEFCSRQFGEKGQVCSVESFIKLDYPLGVAGNFATYESAVHGFGAVDQLRKDRAQLRKKQAAIAQSEGGAGPLAKLGPRLRRRTLPFWEDRVGLYALPFPGADASVITDSQLRLRRVPQVACYIGVQSWWSVFKVTVAGMLFSFFARWAWGRALLLRTAPLVTFGVVGTQPTDEQIEASSFQVTLFGRGWAKKPTPSSADGALPPPDQECVVRVAGPEAGYHATPIAVVWAALTLLRERSKLPEGGGVFMPAAAFAKTSYIDQLNKHGFQFSVISKRKL